MIRRALCCWQWATLTNTSFSFGEQIVSTLILSNVCLSFVGAAHKKFSDTKAMPEVTSHHIFSPPMRETATGC